MKVILTHDVHNVGRAGDVKNVADGYARNYLLPNGLAIKATASALKELQAHQTAEADHEARLATRTENLMRRLSEITLTFEAKASDKGRLFGSITPADIADALEREVGEKFDRRKHILTEPLREVGQHSVSVRLTPAVIGRVKVVIKPEGGELPAPDADAPAVAGESIA